MLSDSEKDALKKKFAVLVNDVELAVFTQELECQFCKETRELVLGLAELSPKLKVKVYDFVKNGDEAIKYNIKKSLLSPSSGAKITVSGITACLQAMNLQLLWMIS